MRYPTGEAWDPTQPLCHHTLLAQYVAEEHTLVRGLVQKAQQHLGALTGGNPDFVGYGARQSKSVDEQVEAVYTQIKHLELTFREPPSGRGHSRHLQRIRTIAEIFSDRAGACIDFVVLFASCLLQVGIHPLIVVVGKVPDLHAILGYWREKTGGFRHPGTGLLQPAVNGKTFWKAAVAPAEASALGVVEALYARRACQKSFSDAKKEAITVLSQSVVRFAVDVEACRSLGIESAQPLPGGSGRRVAATAAKTGRVASASLRKSRVQLPGEVLAIELLKETVVLRRRGNNILGDIDRRNVDEVVISTAGKSDACRQYVFGQEGRLRIEDRAVQEFLVGASAKPKVKIPLASRGGREFRLRWASGGVLSIVNFRAPNAREPRQWVPLFFRDIRPYGWNIALGSSERSFDDYRRLRRGYSLDAELNNPSIFIFREFREECLVVTGDPRKTRQLRFRRFRAATPFPRQGPKSLAKEFAKKHRALRKEEDGLRMQRGDDLPLRLKETNTTLRVRSADKRARLVSDVLLAFSLLDLGIEVVKVVEYNLEENDSMLDGEILDDPESGRAELVRMPIALISCDYLKKVFGPEGDWHHYTYGLEPSIEVQPPPAGDVHLFPWDVIQRMSLVKEKKKSTSARQLSRFVEWYEKFGKHYFLDASGKVTNQLLPGLFVPGTAKILNQYFSQATACGGC